LTGLADIAGNHDRAPEPLRERAHERFGFCVQISNRELRTGAVKHFGAAISYAVPVGDADDQALLAFEQHILLRP
jgi:hypothetical protein